MQKKAKILVIDDDPDIQAALEALLAANYQVLSAYNGEEGLKKVVDERPDLIICDVIMPVKDGFTTVRELKTDSRYHFFSHIPVLMLTVYPGQREQLHLSMREGMTMEAEEYIQKPFDQQELLHRIEELLKK